MTNPTLMSVNDVRKSFATLRGPLKAVDGVSFSINPGETLALVGESGSGKSTLAMILLGLIAADSGILAFDGSAATPIADRAHRRPDQGLGIVFQNPHSSLNPRMKVRSLVAEPLRASSNLSGNALADRVITLLEQVGLGRQHMERYPHELSGGQMQRVAIARALALEPKLLILDEPTAALDVSVRMQTLKLLKSLQEHHGTSYLYITHDLGTVDYIADRIIVMYLGRIVESGRVEDVFAAPKHPYTRALLDAVPTLDPRSRGVFVTLEGEIPSPVNRPSGCSFAPRCRWKTGRCDEIDPALVVANPGRGFACHHPLASVPDELDR
ncbi:ABC transporter ATP-binding protein [Sinorhizobium meliloti]|uniref:ABC transporter ATP-binding protein n=1 Tax=Rhizobium meliloti TaxID=382 RepID=UPI00037655BF|nr:ABC transporter ATP-binding protein [Sinorhizobium meliloti]MDE3878719.1 ABC transporter ATP-binding protein [Sinorhizobium meliloti]MDE4604598.1 ABC transporter ATP-binding protein [Sinorhizobium meliloti]MDX0315678.1 ATP-binding cassette domain-containing protein [Sinorhizobium meliloti]RVH03944.1 ABC transporter ATP-binding protein [Sinorhizobium meliloti]UDU21158.1 ABC transporter ATP-binding protein [Sinorhizobium meliloti]